MEKGKSRKKGSKAHYFFLAPHMLIFIIFFFIPFIYGIYISFTKWDMFSKPQWIGFENYLTLFTNKDSSFYRQFWNGFGNTLRFVIMIVPFQIAVPLIIALAIYAKPKGARIFQGIIYIPTLFSISAVILTWFFILHPSYGLINKLFGLEINWFGEQPYAWTSIIIVTIWWIIGLNMVIYVAALGGIDSSIIESAQIDGAGWGRRIIHIYIPLIKFPLLFTILSATTSQFNIYGQPLMLTKGGPTESTFVLIMYIRNLAFGSGKPIAGIASAMAVILGFVIGIFSVAQMIVLIKLQDE